MTIYERFSIVIAVFPVDFNHPRCDVIIIRRILCFYFDLHNYKRQMSVSRFLAIASSTKWRAIRFTSIVPMYVFSSPFDLRALELAFEKCIRGKSTIFFFFYIVRQTRSIFDTITLDGEYWRKTNAQILYNQPYLFTRFFCFFFLRKFFPDKRNISFRCKNRSSLENTREKRISSF